MIHLLFSSKFGRLEAQESAAPFICFTSRGTALAKSHHGIYHHVKQEATEWGEASLAISQQRELMRVPWKLIPSPGSASNDLFTLQ